MTVPPSEPNVHLVDQVEAVVERARAVARRRAEDGRLIGAGTRAKLAELSRELAELAAGVDRESDLEAQWQELTEGRCTQWETRRN